MKEGTHPSLEKVARLAGVSVSTASRALNGHPRLLASTVAAVKTAARKVGYHTNPFISDAMRRVRCRTRVGHFGAIAYLTFHDSASGWQRNATYLRFHEGAARRASDLGFSLDLIWARQPDLDAKRLTAILRARGILGVIVGPRPKQPQSEVIDWSQFASASVGVPLPGLQLHRAGSHHPRVMEGLLEALAQRGYRRPGLVLLESQCSKTDPGWLTTWCFHQQNHPSRTRVPLLRLPALDPKAVVQWAQKHEPDVVIGVEEELATILSRHGFRIPEEIGFAHLSRPERPDAPAGIDQRPRAVGAAAVDLVVGQIFSDERGAPDAPHSLLIEGEWKDGWSLRAG